MKDTANRSTLGTVVYGLLIIVPVAIIFLLLVKMTEILEKVATPLGLESNFGAAIALVIVAVIAVGTWGLLRDSLRLALDAVVTDGRGRVDGLLEVAACFGERLFAVHHAGTGHLP